MDFVVTLTSPRFVAGVSPQLGGSLVYFGLVDDGTCIPHDFVRPASARAWAQLAARLTSGYPLVPYSNRIGDGRFTFDGRSHALSSNSPVSAHPLHGIGWLREWSVVSSAPDRLILVCAHLPTGRADAQWPWAFTATQTFALDDTALTWTLVLTNDDAETMPAGIGLHQFVPKTPRMELHCATKAVWRNDKRMLPVERMKVPAEWDFNARRPVGELTVDNCFAGWSREALLVWPERGWSLRLAASDVFGHMIAFTSPERDSIAIEPVSHANNAVNLAATRADTGLVRLAPGESLSGSLTMTPVQDC
ncbi:MAG: aldose 1-epimerase [Betaproteobacteria bacterium]